MKKQLTQGEMINEIIGLASRSAMIHEKFFNGADLFFTLAYRTERDLKKLCKQLNIPTNQK